MWGHRPVWTFEFVSLSLSMTASRRRLHQINPMEPLLSSLSRNPPCGHCCPCFWHMCTQQSCVLKRHESAICTGKFTRPQPPVFMPSPLSVGLASTAREQREEKSSCLFPSHLANMRSDKDTTSLGRTRKTTSSMSSRTTAVKTGVSPPRAISRGLPATRP